MAVGAAGGLADREVAVTGRLASMTHDEAQQRIADAGGRWVAEPRPATAFLVVGEEGWPLREDGQLTRALQEAQRLQRFGGGPRIVSEREFLELLGADTDPGLHRLYTTVQLARILEVPPGRLRAWLRCGLIAPARTHRRLCFFDFAQVASAKALCALSARGASSARIRRSLEQLRAWLPQAERALLQIEAIERGGPLLVRLEDGRLAEPNGQLRLDFAAGREAREPRPGPGPRVPRTLEQWFERGIAAEEAGALEQAAEAYHEAMLAGGPQPEICFNLGNTLFGLGRTAEAAQRFAQATELDPEYVEAWNNLGNTLAEIGRTSEAVRAYERALAIEPRYADAHYNLAQTLSSAGDLAGACAHWRAYLLHDPASAWAREVREQLARFEPRRGPAG
jgi:tetratricopeptide (TPR) repeat protein